MLLLAVAGLTVLVFLLSTCYLYRKLRFHSEKLETVRAGEQDMFIDFFGKGSTDRFPYHQALHEIRRWESLPAFLPVTAALDEVRKVLRDPGVHRVAQIDLKLRTRTQKGRIRAESPSGIEFTTSQAGLGALLEKGFGRPADIFSACANEARRGETGTVTVNLRLTPQESYLSSLRN